MYKKNNDLIILDNRNTNKSINNILSCDNNIICNNNENKENKENIIDLLHIADSTSSLMSKSSFDILDNFDDEDSMDLEIIPHFSPLKRLKKSKINNKIQNSKLKSNTKTSHINDSIIILDDFNSPSEECSNTSILSNYDEEDDDLIYPLPDKFITSPEYNDNSNSRSCKKKALYSIKRDTTKVIQQKEQLRSLKKSQSKTNNWRRRSSFIDKEAYCKGRNKDDEYFDYSSDDFNDFIDDSDTSHLSSSNDIEIISDISDDIDNDNPISIESTEEMDEDDDEILKFIEEEEAKLIKIEVENINKKHPKHQNTNDPIENIDKKGNRIRDKEIITGNTIILVDLDDDDNIKPIKPKIIDIDDDSIDENDTNTLKEDDNTLSNLFSKLQIKNHPSACHDRSSKWNMTCCSTDNLSKTELVWQKIVNNNRKQNNNYKQITLDPIFKENRENIALQCFKLYNETIFDNKLSSNIPIVWEYKKGAAGACFTKRKGNNYSITKILLNPSNNKTELELKQTLLHEMCHAATWIINKARGHGKKWLIWVKKAESKYPKLAPVGRSLFSGWEYPYFCSNYNCANEYFSHTRSTRKICRKCKYPVVLPPNWREPARYSKPLTKFAIFVKDNYSKVKENYNEYSHSQIMSQLSILYKQNKN